MPNQALQDNPPSWGLRARRGLQSALLWLGWFLVASVAVDYYRRPNLPVHGLDEVVYDVSRKAWNLAESSVEKPLILYFWAEWCSMCSLTSPAMETLHQAGYPVLGVALQSGTNEAVRKYQAQSALSFPTLNDPEGDFSSRWRVYATPTIVFLKDGKIIHHTTGLSSSWGLRLRFWWSQWIS